VPAAWYFRGLFSFFWIIMASAGSSRVDQAPTDVLIVGSDTPVGVALQGAFAQWGRHRALPVTLAASRWRSERQAKKTARKDKPGAVVDLRMASLIAAGEVPAALDIDRSHWLAKACERSDIDYILLSSDQVFAGQSGRTLRDKDVPDACTEPGFQIVELENRLQQSAPSAIVLRTGPLFASFDRNLLTRVLGSMSNASSPVFDDSDVFCPVASVDAARVTAAMLDQLSAGAEAQGVFQYCSGDRTTEYGFAEAVLAAASQYSDCGQTLISAPEPEPDGATMRGTTRVLDCGRIRDSFAIKQVPWRGFVNPLVKQYYQTLAEASQDHQATRP
jgi:dTDP-4-dehydrorhamnose reductase